MSQGGLFWTKCISKGESIGSWASSSSSSQAGSPCVWGEGPQLKPGNQVALALLTHPVTSMGLLLDVSKCSRKLLTSDRLVPTADGGRWGKKSGEASSSPELPDVSVASLDPEAAPKIDTPYSLTYAGQKPRLQSMPCGWDAGQVPFPVALTLSPLPHLFGRFHLFTERASRRRQRPRRRLWSAGRGQQAQALSAVWP